MSYEGSRHHEIASLIRGRAPLPQRHSPRMSLDGHNLGRGGSEPPVIGAGAEPEQPASRPRPNIYRRSA